MKPKFVFLWFYVFMKLRLNFQMTILISHVILSENLLNETKKMIQHRKRRKSGIKGTTKLFLIRRLRLS